MATDSTKSAAQWAIEEFATGFAAAVEGMAGTRPEFSCELLTVAPPESSVPAFHWKQPLLGLPGAVFAITAEPGMLTAGQHVMAAAGVEDASPEELRSTFRELLGQAFSLLARSITTRLQRDVAPSLGEDGPEAPEGTIWGSVVFIFTGQKVMVSVGLPAQMLEVLTVEPKVIAQTPNAGSNQTVAEIGAPPPDPGNEARTFDLLLDVELPVSVSFGHAHVPLKDVLKLTTGSIVELNRAIIEPVDIVVNNCVIAKGEVVVIEGNFGVRIQHVVSRSERLRSLQ